MKRFLNLAVVGLIAGMGMVGCGLLDAVDDDSVTIKINEPLSSIAGDYSAYVEATVSANVEITSIKFTVTTAEGATVSEDLIDVKKDNIPTGEEKITIEKNGEMEVSITPATDACEGNYILTIEATAGSVTSTKEDSFSVTDAKDCSIPDGTPVETIELDAGSNGHSTLGSSIDLDGGTVWKMADAANNVSKIDICYSHTGTGDDKVGSPLWAKESGYGYASSWSDPPNTKILKITMTSAEFDAVETKEAIEDKWSGNGESSLVVVEDDIFIVKTTESAYALVRITSQVAGEDGKITIKVAR